MNIFETLIVQPIFNLLMGLYSIIPGGDFGIAIILFTILLRFALWPIVTRQLHQVKAMRKLQPELKKIKVAAKGNRQQESMQMLELYKKHGVKPFRSILMLLIQLPIFIALYQVIQIFTIRREQIESFTYNFLEGIEPIRKIIDDPASFNENLFGIIDLTSSAIRADGITMIFLILLSVLAAFTQFIISKQTMPTTSNKRFRDVMAEAADGKQPDQAELNAVMMSKMTKILPIVMLFIMLGLPGAIALYYATSNIFAALQQKYLLSKDADEMDKLADEVIKAPGKKATAKARAKEAREAQVTKVTRIKAKDTPKKK